MIFTVGSLFSGIGGLDLAAQWAGFETAWFVEKEPFCQKVLAKHWPDVPIHTDIFDCHNLPHVDVMVGGFPCQPFSVAGKQQGAKDERFLLPEMLRVINEVQPYAVLFENVPGFPSLNNGAEFKQLLRTLAEMGFDAEWGHLRAADFGAPHKRERWFCVAYMVNPAQRSFRQRESPEREQQQAFSGTAGERDDCESLRRSPTTGSSKEKNMGNASGERCTECSVIASQRETGFCAGGSHAERGDCEQPKSRLGGSMSDGVSTGMDFLGWAASPGKTQYTYEPPRVTASAPPHRTPRLKALGNAVVPQVAYPLMLAIHKWLDEVLSR